MPCHKQCGLGFTCNVEGKAAGIHKTRLYSIFCTQSQRSQSKPIMRKDDGGCSERDEEMKWVRNDEKSQSQPTCDQVNFDPNSN
jgi:hypothetical protein